LICKQTAENFIKRKKETLKAIKYFGPSCHRHLPLAKQNDREPIAVQTKQLENMTGKKSY